MPTGRGLKIRIPPELMPDEETCLRYFELYFQNVHPYVPVLNRTHFYTQWHTDRDSISPLILEAILAIGGRFANEPAQGQQWLALASSKLIKHHVEKALETKVRRTCRLIHGRSSIEHPPGSTHHPQGSGSCTQARLLLSLVDDDCSVRPDG